MSVRRVTKCSRAQTYFVIDATITLKVTALMGVRHHKQVSDPRRSEYPHRRRPRVGEGIDAGDATERAAPSGTSGSQGRSRGHRALSPTAPRPGAHGRGNAQGERL